jgi:hypothetical protein
MLSLGWNERNAPEQLVSQSSRIIPQKLRLYCNGIPELGGIAFVDPRATRVSREAICQSAKNGCGLCGGLEQGTENIPKLRGLLGDVNIQRQALSESMLEIVAIVLEEPESKTWSIDPV